MSKIKNTKVYTKENEPTLSDFLVGTKDSNGITKSFSLGAILQLLNSSNGVNNIQFKFSNGLHPTIDFLSAGYFFTNTNSTEVGDFTQLIFNKETLYPIDLSPLFNKLGVSDNVVLRLENPSDPNNFFNFKVISFEDHTDYFTFGVQPYNDLYLGEFINENVYSLYFDVNSTLPQDFSNVVYFDSDNPETATIFDTNNPPITNDDSLKADDDNLYIDNDANSWVYKTSTASYETKEITSSSSNFYLDGTLTDAGNNKTANIKRSGRVGGANGINPDDFVTKNQHDLKENSSNKTGTVVGNEASTSLYASIKGLVDWLTSSKIKSILGITTLSGSNTGDETKSTLNAKLDYELERACSDETSNLSVKTVITFRMPCEMIISEVRISLNEPPTLSSLIVDVKQSGTSIFSTLVSIDASETTSVTASVPAVISTPSLTDNSIITVSITQVGSGNAGKGLKILFKGKRI